MRLLSARQHDFDWWDARRGKASGSNMAAIMGFLKRGDKKGGENAERRAYKIKIVTETLLNAPLMDGYKSPAMQWGVDNEDLALAAYEVRSGNDVTRVGFALHDGIDRFGGSCDGLVGADGVVEFKCPETTTHVRWMDEQVVPADHEPQCSAYLAITGRAWVDFVSFDPRLPARMQVFVKRMERDESRIAELEAGAVKFLAEVDEMIARLNALNPEAERPVAASLDNMNLDDFADLMIQTSGGSV